MFSCNILVEKQLNYRSEVARTRRHVNGLATSDRAEQDGSALCRTAGVPKLVILDLKRGFGIHISSSFALASVVFCRASRPIFGLRVTVCKRLRQNVAGKHCQQCFLPCGEKIKVTPCRYDRWCTLCAFGTVTLRILIRWRSSWVRSIALDLCFPAHPRTPRTDKYS